LGAERAISIIQTDQPGNDFASLFEASCGPAVGPAVGPTLAAELDGGHGDPRASTFIARMESSVARRMEAAPERMVIPLAKMTLLKEG
jgi:hypothetical protein